MESPLKREFEYFLAHHREFAEKYDGKYLVIKDQAVVGVYDDEMTAISETKKKHELGTFLVQQVKPGVDEYSQTFHSRVVFS